MKKILIVVFILSFVNSYAAEPVTNDLEAAKQEAKAGHKLIFMKFSGSDWCVPCINVQKKVIDTEEFQEFAHTRLVLMNIDFPRQKKNMLSADDTKKNAALAEKYNREGLFPKFLLLDENGTVLAQWTGLEKMEPQYLESKILPYIEKK
ncbi:MAG: thioredoxin family protein [Tannerella sp.]|jgi:thioredoxin-related protein|nr:thioredoxin family protein [Tannerella sp.]